MKSLSKVFSKILKPELNPVLKSKGFTIDGNVLISPKGDRMVRTLIDGKAVLQKEESFLKELERQKAQALREKASKDLENKAKKQIIDFNKKAEDFA